MLKEGTVVGGVSIVINTSADDNERSTRIMYIRLLAVSLNFQGRSIGKGLVQLCKDKAADLSIQRVITQVPHGVHEFYRKCGFENTARADVAMNTIMHIGSIFVRYESCTNMELELCIHGDCNDSKTKWLVHKAMSSSRDTSTKELLTCHRKLIDRIIECQQRRDKKAVEELLDALSYVRIFMLHPIAIKEKVSTAVGD